MKLKYLIFINDLSIVNSLSKEKLCINCKYFIKNIFTESKYAKCKAFPYIIDNNNFLITGIKQNIEKNYYYCSTARSSNGLCDIDGKKYIKK